VAVGAAEPAVVGKLPFEHVVLVKKPTASVIMVDRNRPRAAGVGHLADIGAMGHDVIALDHRVGLDVRAPL
jgi:hypothetical protein